MPYPNLESAPDHPYVPASEAPSSLLCRLGLHRWTKWQQYDWQGSVYVWSAWIETPLKSVEAAERR